MRVTPFHPFTLQSYPSACLDTPFAVHGGLTYQAFHLTVQFTVHTAGTILLLPPPSQCPGRQDRLWEHTCFELFFAPVASQTYWEINASPGGNWNTYGFDAYRQGMRPEFLMQVSHLTCGFQPADTFKLSFRVEMSPLLQAYAGTQGVLECSPCCILVDGTQQKSYWAMQHQLSRPDFHQRTSFTLQLPSLVGT